MTTAVTIGTTNFGSTGELVVDLLFGLACAFWGYHTSRRHRVARGVTPWRLPSVVWAFICLVLQPFGIIMELVAEFTTRPAMSEGPNDLAPTFASYPPPSTPPVVEASPQGEVAALRPMAFAAPNDGSGMPALFGWYADPARRHEFRYWDGRYWSDHVCDNGSISSDPPTIDGRASIA